MTSVSPESTTPRPARSRLWPRAAARVHQFGHDALEFLYPSSCALCLAETGSIANLCQDCLKGVSGEDGPVCQRCCAPVGPHLDTAAGCIHCRSDRFAFERVYALGAYDGLLRIAVQRAKHQSSGQMAGALAQRWLARWGSDLQREACDLIVPVPAHWTTRLSRSAAPADAVARELARFLMVPCDLHILRKSRRTAPQASLSPTQRRENLRGAFRMSRGVQFSGADVVLVDDVLTTGTTAHRAARVLKNAGAGRIIVAVIARGIGR